MRILLAAALLCACAGTPTVGDSNTPALPSTEAAPPYEDADTRLRARISADPHFAGLYLEGGRVIVLFTDDNSAARLAGYTSDSRYAARAARHTLAELRAAQEALGASFQREGLYYMWSSVDVRANVFEIEVQSEADTREQAAARGIAIPDFVVFRSRNGIVAEAQSIPPVERFPQARFPAGAEMQALIRGRLSIVNGCIRIGEDLVVWPSSALLEREGDAIRVRDRQTGTVVRIGAEMEMGGGETREVDQTHLTAPIPASCPGPYLIAATGWRER